MPTIDASKRDLEHLVGKKFSREQLEDALLYAKGELDALQGDALKIDIKETNRPDLWSAEGIARELRARLGMHRGLPRIPLKKGRVKLIIEESVKKSRPCMRAAVVKGLHVDENFIAQIVQLQEKVSMTFGRKRKELGIGLYDFDCMTPPVHYKGCTPGEIKFAPLAFTEKMTLREILREHPKGREYAHLLSGLQRYPIVIDSKDVVCSMPPIINSNDTGKVTKKTKNIFVECTGWNEKTVNTGLNVIVAALADRGGKIERVLVQDGKKKTWSPDFTPRHITVDADYARKISGMNWTQREMAQLLERAGYAVKSRGKKLVVHYPAYRQDILHPVDVVEDMIISHGYNRISPQPVQMRVRGELLSSNVRIDAVRDCCIGLGFQEVLTFILSSRDAQEKKMGFQKQELAEIANPVSANWSVFRNSLLPGLLEFTAKNQHVSFPHRIFETGKVVIPDAKSETRVREPTHFALLLAGEKTSYTEMKSLVDSVCKNMGWKVNVAAAEHPAFVSGRTAGISGSVHGMIGELNPGVLKNFGIDTKISACEIEY